MDFHEINQIENVTKGQLLVRKTMATMGTDGLAVDGSVIAARHGKDKPLLAGKNVILSEDKLQVYSLIDGQVSITSNNVINVFPLYEVNGDVDYSVGNLNFLGSIIVKGSVLPGFKITAAGDIRIFGSVDAAEIKAEGSIEIASGIIGRNKALIIAGMSIKANYAQEATLIAKQDIIVNQSVLHCQVQSGSYIKCQGQKGLIVGGKLQANLGVAARIIGNTMSTTTIIEVGALPELRMELSAVSEKLSSCRSNLEKTEQALTLLESIQKKGIGFSQEKSDMLIKLSNSRSLLNQEIHMLEVKHDELELSWEESEKASVVATTVVNPGTKIAIGKAVKYINTETTGCHFFYEGGDIVNRK